MVEFYDEQEEQKKKVEELIKEGKRKRKSWKQQTRKRKFISIKCSTCGSTMDKGLEQRDDSICITCLETKQKGYRKHTKEDYNIMYVID